MHRKILLTGATSKICTEFKNLCVNEQQSCVFVELGRSVTSSHRVDLANLDAIDCLAEVICECDKIVLAHGVIGTQRFAERTEQDIVDSVKTNLLSHIRIIEIALEGNPNARIVVVGSESGFKGSYDIAYAISKAALHKYIEERKLKYSEQQLVCVAPSIMVDAGMTTRRHDQENVQSSILANPKARGLTSMETAKMIHFLLNVDRGYTSNVVIHMNGGKFARM